MKKLEKEVVDKGHNVTMMERIDLGHSQKEMFTLDEGKAHSKGYFELTHHELGVDFIGLPHSVPDIALM